MSTTRTVEPQSERNSQRRATSILIAIRQSLVAEGIEILAKMAGYHVETTRGSFERSDQAIQFSDDAILICDLSLVTEMARTKGLFEVWPSNRVVVITSVQQIRQCPSVPSTKINGWVGLGSRFSMLGTAIDHVAQGRTFIDPALQQALSERRECNGHKLTKRQLQILQLVAIGKSSKKIAFDLGISPSTVENHRARMMHKFGVNSSVELLRIALQFGLL